jgi:hypothetical protein
MLEHSRELVMAVAKDVGPHLDRIAHHPLDRKAPVVDLRSDPFD